MTKPQVTKPWSKQMYEWNDMVSDLMKVELRIQMNKAMVSNDRDVLNELLSICGGISCGEGYDIDDIWDMCLTELDRVPNYWLNDEWGYAVENGIVSDCVKLNFVGY